MLEQQQQLSGALLLHPFPAWTFRVGEQHSGIGLHGDPFTVSPHAMAQVDLRPGGGQIRVQAADLPQGLLADQHAGQGDGQDVLSPVGLALIDLTGVDPCDDAPAMGQGDAHVDQGVGLVDGMLHGVGGSGGGLAEADSFGADHRGVRRVGGKADQLGQRLGPGDGLVDHEPQPGPVTGRGRGPSARAAVLAQAPRHLGELLGVLGAAPFDGLGVDGQRAPAARPPGSGLEPVLGTGVGAVRGVRFGGALVGEPLFPAHGGPLFPARGGALPPAHGGPLPPARSGPLPPAHGGAPVDQVQRLAHGTGPADGAGGDQHLVDVTARQEVLERGARFGGERGRRDRDDAVRRPALRRDSGCGRFQGERARRPAQQDDSGDSALIHPATESDRPALELATLALGQPAPDAEPLIVLERILEALRTYLAGDAHLLRQIGRAHV